MSTWRPCSTCKKPINHGAKHWVCSVSTCNRPPVPLVFCSVACWDSHVPLMNHRDPWCKEAFAPDGPPREAATTANPSARSEAHQAEARRRRLARPAHTQPKVETDILIVASRLKDYIDRKAGYKTSADVLQALSDIVRTETDRAIRSAAEEGRRTVKGRDFR